MKLGYVFEAEFSSWWNFRLSHAFGESLSFNCQKG